MAISEFKYYGQFELDPLMQQLSPHCDNRCYYFQHIISII